MVSATAMSDGMTTSLVAKVPAYKPSTDGSLPAQALATLTGIRNDGCPAEPPLTPDSAEWPLFELPTAIHKDDERSPDDWIPRRPELIRLTGRHPFNVEPPLPLSMAKGFMTPVGLHFVRNHGAVPKLRWDQHKLTINGLVNAPQTFTMDELLKLPTHDVTCLLVCAGNRRKEQNMVKKTIGFNWGHSACSCSTWTGVRLCDLLRLCGVQTDNTMAQYVSFRGVQNELPQGKDGSYGTSLTLAKALDPANDIMVAYKQNGRFLTPDHGYPVRMIIPGHIGGRMVKYVEEITVTPVESDNFYHYHDNRVLPSHVDAELAKKEGWWFKEDFIINDLNINSATAFPQHQEVLPLAAGPSYTVKGYAYSGGGRKIIRAEISLDGCQTWRLANIHRYEKPTQHGKYWCWVFWSIDVPLADLMRAPELVCRAWDSAMNTQPNTFTWNVMGMMNNCVFRIKIHPHTTPDGSLALKFEHPTVAGPTPGGWMDKSAEEEVEAAVAALAAAAAAVEPLANGKGPEGPRLIAMSEVEQHITRDSCWFVHGGKVYDATPFLKAHPGGADSILLVAGTDATEEFDAIHSVKAKNMLVDYYIGDLAPEGYVPPATGTIDIADNRSTSSSSSIDAASSASVEGPSEDLGALVEAPVALDARKKLSLPLIEKVALSHNVRKFRFGLPTPQHRFGLPVGKHVFLSARVNGELVMRAYTPSSSDEDQGYFDLVVKVYFPNEHPKFPDGGKMSQHLESLKIGDTIDVKGPIGHMEYKGDGHFALDGEAHHATHFSMIAGGTGITPMYQVIKAALRKGCNIQMALLYANQTPDDILLREELDDLAAQHSNFKVWYTVDRAPDDWQYSTGFIDEAMVKARLFPAAADNSAVALLCGPPPMLKFACIPNLEKNGYVAEHMIQF
jgi:nitrate reductase (NAD(P)H)